MNSFKSTSIVFLLIISYGILYFSCDNLPEKPAYLSYDPNNPDYVDPRVTIISPPDDEVIANENITIAWEGNVPEIAFRYRLNYQPYSSFTSEKSVHFTNLVNGIHYFSVYGQYPTGWTSSSQSIRFLIWDYSGPGLSLYPAEIRHPKTWSVYIQLISVDTSPINSLHAKVLFNPVQVEATSVQFYSDEEAFLLKNGGRLVNDFEIDSTLGQVLLTSQVLEGNPPDVSGSGRIAEISFKPAEGDSTIIEISPESYFTTSAGVQIPLILNTGTKIIFPGK